MSTVLDNSARTIHLPTQVGGAMEEHALKAKPTGRKSLRLSDLREGETGRVVRVSIAEKGCRKRFAEMGLSAGMKVTVVGTGDTLMVVFGGSRMGLAARCAEEISVIRV